MRQSSDAWRTIRGSRRRSRPSHSPCLTSRRLRCSRFTSRTRAARCCIETSRRSSSKAIRRSRRNSPMAGMCGSRPFPRRPRAAHTGRSNSGPFSAVKRSTARSGYFEYRIPWPAGLTASDVASATFLVEASAKRLNGKDRDTTASANDDYMRGGGFHDPSRNPNSYPMTGTTPFPSAVMMTVNGHLAGRWELADDPADSRGILSWHAQPHDGHLYEAGSYGQLVRVPVPAAALADAARTGTVVVRLTVDAALPGGLAIYGSSFGRYPIDPTVLFVLR